MLITNFSSGELSKTLFGRIDLGQYFQGAARIENFNIIPTGGIMRRSGTERLQMLPDDGRLIPFVIDRESSFLLYLTPGKIGVYSLSGGHIAGTHEIIESSSALHLYENLSEIKEVQYTQSFDKMILCHQNYRPLKVAMVNGLLEVSGFQIDIDVELVAREGVQTAQFAEQDEKYLSFQWLDKEGEWPATATFFNGRLIFAGTKGNPQRLFASKADDINKFATYKKFITETRQYIAVNGRIKPGTNEIELVDPAEIGKFTRAPGEYYVESPFYPEGTRVLFVQGKTIFVDNSTESISLNPQQMEEFAAWRTEIEKNDHWRGGEHGRYLLKIVYNYEDKVLGIVPVLSHITTTVIRYKNGKYEVTVIKFDKTEGLQFLNGGDIYNGMDFSELNAEIISHDVYGIARKEVQACIESRDYLYDLVYKKVGPSITENHLENFNQFINDFWDYIKLNMQKTFMWNGVRYTLYGTPFEILLQLYAGATTFESLITLYSKEHTTDKYPTADCGFTFEIASDSSDAIRWLVVNKGLIVGTETAEWIIPPGVTATNIQAQRNSSYGSDRIQGTAIGDATCFFQAGKKSLVEYYIPQQDNNFRANNMAIMAPEMLHEGAARDFDYTLSPYTKLFITRDDGTIATLLYDRSLGVFAWTRHVQAGNVKSLAVVPGSLGFDDVYLIVEYNGAFFLERLDYDGKVFLDSFTKVDSGTWSGARANYSGFGVCACRIKEGNLYEILDADTEPDWQEGGEVYLGYMFESIMRTLPVLANGKMAKQRITTLTFRFLESYLPFVSSIAGGENIKTDTITNLQTPFSGVHKIPFPGDWDPDVQAELAYCEAGPVKILSINAEVQ